MHKSWNEFISYLNQSDIRGFSQVNGFAETPPSKNADYYRIIVDSQTSYFQDL